MRLCSQHRFLDRETTNVCSLTEGTESRGREPSQMSVSTFTLYAALYDSAESASCHNLFDLNFRLIHLEGSELKGTHQLLSTSVAWVRERTIPTERPPLVGEVSANICGWRMPRGKHDGSLRPYSRISRPVAPGTLNKNGNAVKQSRDKKGPIYSHLISWPQNKIIIQRHLPRVEAG
jgi:hypothetical protein